LRRDAAGDDFYYAGAKAPCPGADSGLFEGMIFSTIKQGGTQ
jgi:hypothetical protein